MELVEGCRHSLGSSVPAVASSTARAAAAGSLSFPMDDFFGDSQLCWPRAITSQQRLLRLFVAWAVVADRCNARPIGRQQSLSNAISSPSTVCSRGASPWAGGAVLEEPGRALQTAVWTPYGRIIYKIIFEAQELQRKPYRRSFTPACLNNASEVGDVTNRDRDSELVIMSMRPHQRFYRAMGEEQAAGTITDIGGQLAGCLATVPLNPTSFPPSTIRSLRWSATWLLLTTWPAALPVAPLASLLLCRLLSVFPPAYASVGWEVSPACQRQQAAGDS